ncbi:hypothetical protein IFM46972_00598 [Aspergillus udagawae]|uniref:Protein-arginine deiminase C-terminal domain-containing protein n=1 Tax=Aspergillus udagawae TaxID=91492 RepID=A0A8H3N5L0_9EURO|nr:hypothetical protein IFM46972_00598 [Aspergillus udagawae]
MRSLQPAATLLGTYYWHQNVAPLRAVPVKESSDHPYANMYTTPKVAYDRVRPFLNDDPQTSASSPWRLIDREFAFNASPLRKGLVLGLDGRELVKDVNAWDGNVVNVDTLVSVAANRTPLLLLIQSDDIWAQDFLELTYASMPGPQGPVSIRIMLRSAQSTRTTGRQVFEFLRNKGVGGSQPAPGFGHREINSFGNLETIPP